MRWLNILLIFTTFIAYLAPFISPATLSVFSFFGLLYPWLILSNVLFILFWWYKKDWYALFSLGCLLIGFNYLSTFIGLNTEENKNPNSLKVVTYNLFGMRGYGADAKFKYGDKIDEFKRTQQQFGRVDIFAGQEMNDYLAGVVSDILDLSYKHHHKSNGILTRLPIKNKGIVPFKNSRTNSCIWADVEKDGQRFRIYSVHLQSNKISGTTAKLSKEADLRKKETWIDIKTILGSYRTAAKVRANQADLVAAHIAQCPHPVVIVGDFNDTPLSYIYRTFAHQRKDSFCEKGIGFGTTYAGNIPALRIDYILADDVFDIGTHEVFRSKISDHYGIGSKIILQK